MKNIIENEIKEHMDMIRNNHKLIPKIEGSAKLMLEAFEKGNKVLICGNGGSAADAQHLAAELMGKFETTRQPLPVISLTTDSSFITAWSNDDTFDNLFSRQVEGLGKRGDVLITITTSGNSPNIINALKKSKELGMKSISFLGKSGGPTKGIADIDIHVEHERTARIQELHELCYHILCSIIDKNTNIQK